MNFESLEPCFDIRGRDSEIQKGVLTTRGISHSVSVVPGWLVTKHHMHDSHTF
jgi:hypothetical protein